MPRIAPLPLSAGLCGAGVLCCLVLIGRGVTQTLARSEEASATLALMQQHGQDALEAYATAATFDPLDPEPHLQRALILDTSPETAPAAKEELLMAVRIAPSGRTYYRLAQHDGRTGDTAGQIGAFEEAVAREPNNVQSLRALGDAQRKAGQLVAAKATYSAMSDLEASPYGKVRAMPEVVELEFAFAHLALAEMATDAKDFPNAQKEFEAGAKLFREYWSKRTNEMYAVMPDAKKNLYAETYGRLLSEWSATLPPGSPARVALEREQQGIGR